MQPDDGGFVSQHGFTHIVAVAGKDNFEPNSKTAFTRAISEAFKDAGITIGVVRSRMENGKLVLLEMTDDPEGFKKVVDASTNLQYLRTERLTRSMYDKYFANYDNSHFPTPEDVGYAGNSRSKVEDGILIMMFMTDDAKIMKEVIDASSQLEFVKAERLTEEMCNKYQNAGAN